MSIPISYKPHPQIT